MRIILGRISAHYELYFRFSLSFREVEDLLAQRGITVTYETIRQAQSGTRLTRERSPARIQLRGKAAEKRITKTGDRHLRSLLVQAGWVVYRLPSPAAARYDGGHTA